MKDIEMISAATRAENIARNMNAAHWMSEFHHVLAADSLRCEAVRDLHDLASLMGFRLVATSREPASGAEEIADARRAAE
ncbi:hypothetical protein KLEP181_gp39 [Paracoccus phage vB_PmaP_KLEP18-1]|nr:hypothetical protein KLEP181_gp39 [Paracoccus phage vB_PmaP_KLEP18-1]